MVTVYNCINNYTDLEWFPADPVSAVCLFGILIGRPEIARPRSNVSAGVLQGESNPSFDGVMATVAYNIPQDPSHYIIQLVRAPYNGRNHTKVAFLPSDIPIDANLVNDIWNGAQYNDIVKGSFTIAEEEQVTSSIEQGNEVRAFLQFFYDVLCVA
ncbi:hypothetical protein L218DRAFT_948685 [Marasmius fiardii PR-910]|nr:hypothetical protein L218DRAFT_948685 [Marasmius fiardii PR-910]